MLDYACRNSVDVVLLAGDVIDRNNRYYEASIALQEGFARLKDAGIEVFLVSGNHDFDVLPQVIRNHSFDNVHLLGANGHWEISRFERSGEVIQFIGWSFPKQYVTTNPVLQLGALQTDSNFLRLGVLHTDVDKVESRYGPVPLLDLQNADIDIWMLGHIHKPSNFAGEKIIRYPGSPQSLSAKESGRHGALLLTVDQSRVEVEEISFSNCRFEWLNIDVSAVDSQETLRLLVENDLSLAANLKLTELGETVFLVYDLHLNGQNRRCREIKAWAEPLKNDYDMPLATGTRVLVREVSANIRPVIEDHEVLASETSPAGLLAQTILALRNGNSTPFLEELIRDWERNFRTITNSTTYQPLQEQWQREGNPRIAKVLIEQECNRLLNELLFPSN
jgi:DNA repair exonuclease SbcCD nuclease subunit